MAHGLAQLTTPINSPSTTNGPLKTQKKLMVDKVKHY